jgi:hypothetical protein
MKKVTKNPVARRRVIRGPSANSRLASVMHALESMSSAPSFTDPIMEQLQQCPEAFKAGEMVGKMFDTLKYNRDNSKGGDRLLPPTGLVMPLV